MRKLYLNKKQTRWVTYDNLGRPQKIQFTYERKVYKRRIQEFQLNIKYDGQGMEVKETIALVRIEDKYERISNYTLI